MRWMVCVLVLACSVAAHADDCTKPLDTMELNRCEFVRWEKVDAELNAVYADALLAARAEYREKRDIFSEMPNSEATLRIAQRAWIAFRDSNCEDYQQTEFGASMARLMYFSCMTDMTAQRIKELRVLHRIREETAEKR